VLHETTAARTSGAAADPVAPLKQFQAFFDEIVAKNDAELPGYFEQMYARTSRIEIVTADVSFLSELVLVLESRSSST
jgi:hypothetical protein